MATNEAKEYEMEFEFPDEKEAKEVKVAKPDVDIQVEDDTPEEDRGRQPMPKEIVEALENDDLESYSEQVKERMKQMKKVWHDERRAKEAALREHQEAIAIAKKALDENKRLRSTLTEGEKQFIDTVKNSVELEMEMAKRAYKEAYDSGDTDQVIEAQNKMSEINFKRQQILNYRAPLQTPEIDVDNREEVRVPTPDSKTLAWQERNPWWGTDPEMTALALGYHQKLERQFGKQYIGTDEYWQSVDETMRRRFPDYFGEEKTQSGGGRPGQRTDSKPATVVAPASRSTSSKRIVLKQSELNLAKKFGLTPEQYAKEKMRLENQNG